MGQFALIMHIGTKFRWQIYVRFALSYMQMHGIIKIPTIIWYNHHIKSYKVKKWQDLMAKWWARAKSDKKVTILSHPISPSFPLTQEKREPHTQTLLSSQYWNSNVLRHISAIVIFPEVSLQQAFKSGTVAGFILAHFVNCRTVGHGENVGISKDMGV